LKQGFFTLFAYCLLFFLFNSCKNEIEELDHCGSNKIEASITILETPVIGFKNGIIEVQLDSAVSSQVEFSLNDTLYQEFNRFSGLATGNYTLFIRDQDDCIASVLFALNGATGYALTVNNGQGSGQYPQDKLIPIVADEAPFGQFFHRWEGDTEYLTDPLAMSTTLVMPPQDIKVEASYVPDTTLIFDLRVINGSGSGAYSYGEEILIEADASRNFIRWANDVEFIDDPQSSSTTLIMPSQEVEVAAIFDVISFSQDVFPVVDEHCNNDICHGDQYADYENIVVNLPFAVDMIKKCDMPLSGCIDPYEIDIIVEWIEAGTPDN
jgi:hypothetical protein